MQAQNNGYSPEKQVDKNVYIIFCIDTLCGPMQAESVFNLRTGSWLDCAIGTAAHHANIMTIGFMVQSADIPRIEPILTRCFDSFPFKFPLYQKMKQPMIWHLQLVSTEPILNRNNAMLYRKMYNHYDRGTYEYVSRQRVSFRSQ